jgi:TPR repeat protein
VYGAGEYGTFVDYVVRHFMTTRGEFRDSRAESCVDSIGNEEVKAAYAATCEPRPTHSVIAELFMVSKAHTLAFSSQLGLGATVYDGDVTGSPWLERLMHVVSVGLAGLSGCVLPNPSMVYKNAGCYVLGDADLLIDETLVELKTSKSKWMSTKWKCQVLLYAAILRASATRVSSIVILNVATGVSVRADISAWQERESLEWLEAWYGRNVWPLPTCDKAAAVEWFSKEAHLGSARAQYYLGFAYFNGDGVPIDKAAAVEWFRKAADQGHEEAQYYLGFAYFNGDGVTIDKAAAVEWFRKAADQGHAEAQNHLGAAYYNGDGVPVDKATAVEWFRKAAEDGHTEAQYYLGFAYFNGDGVTIDKAAAVEWFRKAADQGHAEAQNHLGAAYYNGDGVPVDKAAAVEWLRKAADQGHAEAQNHLFAAYYNGDGVPVDRAAAREWFRKAEEQGYYKRARMIRRQRKASRAFLAER